jgi:hypothetical protein
MLRRKSDPTRPILWTTWASWFLKVEWGQLTCSLRCGGWCWCSSTNSPLGRTRWCKQRAGFSVPPPFDWHGLCLKNTVTAIQLSASTVEIPSKLLAWKDTC